MVDLVQYAHFLETDLAFVKEMAPKFEAGTYSAGFRPKGKEWVDFTEQTVLLYKRMILTQDAALMATQTKMAQNKLAEVEA